MGQACCKPATLEDSRPLSSDPTATPSFTGGALNDSDDEYWDAASVGSMRSAISTLSLEDALEQWRDDLDGDLADLDRAALAQMRDSGGHLVSKEIEEAAMEVYIPQTVAVKVDTSIAQEEHPSLSGGVVGPLASAMDSYTALQEARHPGGETLSTLVDEARELVKYGRVLEAHATLHVVCSETGRPLSDLSDLVSHSEELGIDIDIAALEADVAAIHDALAGLDDDAGYMVSRNDDFRLLYKHHKGSTCHSLKFRATFSHPVGHILSLAHEWDLLPTWNRFTLDAVTLAQPSILEIFVYGAQWIMKPFKNFQSMVRARGFDLADSHKCLLILATDVLEKDLPAGHAPVPMAAATRRTVNMLKDTCIMLRPLPPDSDGTFRTEARLAAHLDPHIPYVPAVLVNFVLGILAPYIYGQMQKVLDSAFADPNGVFPKRMAEQQELYGLIERRLADIADKL